MHRRTLLQTLAAAGAWAGLSRWSFAQPAVSAADEARLRAIAEVVLPSELKPDGQRDVVNAFLRWIRGYREGAEMDHGYGFTRLRRTPPSPAAKYPAQLAALDRAARARGAAFEALDVSSRRALVTAAIDAAKIERLPGRPDGQHVAVDLLAFYLETPAANDLAYRAAIGRDTCRGLPDSDKRPSRL